MAADEREKTDPFGDAELLPPAQSEGLADRAETALASIPGIFDGVPGLSGLSAAEESPAELSGSEPVGGLPENPDFGAFDLSSPEEAGADREPRIDPSGDGPAVDPTRTTAYEVPLETFSDTSADASAEEPSEPYSEAPLEYSGAAEPGPPLEVADPEPAENPMSQIRQYAEHVVPEKVAVPAAFAFHLSIEGHLTDFDKAKLLDLITREDYGIREIDLEPQFAAGRILIPRISEYAGVLAVQALRGTSAQISLSPAAIDEDALIPAVKNPQPAAYTLSDRYHAAEGIPVTTEGSLPGLTHFIAIDTIVTSAALTSEMVEAHRSSEYQDLLEALIKELKYKAFRRAAQGIVNLQIDLTSLALPSHYRLTVSGLAIRTGQPTPPPAPPRWN